MPMWKKYLLNLQYTNDLTMYTGIAFSGAKIKKITDSFQLVYPGKYTLDWKVNTKTWVLELHPYFENEKEENWWLLKYS